MESCHRCGRPVWCKCRWDLATFRGEPVDEKDAARLGVKASGTDKFSPCMAPETRQCDCHNEYVAELTLAPLIKGELRQKLINAIKNEDGSAVIENFQDELQKIDQKYRNLQESDRRHLKKVNSLIKKNEDLQVENEEKAEECKNTQHLLDTQKQKAKNFDNTVFHLQKDKIERDLKIADMKKEIESLRAAGVDLRNAAMAQLQAKDRELEGCRISEALLKSVSSERDNALLELERYRLQQHMQQVQQLQINASIATSAIPDGHQLHQDLRREISGLNGQIEELKRSKQDFLEQQDNLNRYITENIDLKKNQQNFLEQQHNLNRCTTENIKLKDENLQSERKLKKLEADLKNCQDSYEKLQLKVDSLQSAAVISQSHHAEKQKLTAMLDHLRTEKNDLFGQLERHKLSFKEEARKNRQISADVQNLQQSLSKEQKERSKDRENFEKLKATLEENQAKHEKVLVELKKSADMQKALQKKLAGMKGQGGKTAKLLASHMTLFVDDHEHEMAEKDRRIAKLDFIVSNLRREIHSRNLKKALSDLEDRDCLPPPRLPRVTKTATTPTLPSTQDPTGSCKTENLVLGNIAMDNLSIKTKTNVPVGSITETKEKLTASRVDLTVTSTSSPAVSIPEKVAQTRSFCLSFFLAMSLAVSFLFAICYILWPFFDKHLDLVLQQQRQSGLGPDGSPVGNFLDVIFSERWAGEIRHLKFRCLDYACRRWLGDLYTLVHILRQESNHPNVSIVARLTSTRHLYD